MTVPLEPNVKLAFDGMKTVVSDGRRIIWADWMKVRLRTYYVVKQIVYGAGPERDMLVSYITI